MNNYTRNILLISAIVISSLGAYSFYLTKQDYAADSVIFNTSKNIAINGYDPVGISEGYTTPSNPEVYSVKAGLLFLHYSPAYQDHWETNRGTNLILANGNWNFLRSQLLKKQNNQ